VQPLTILDPTIKLFFGTTTVPAPVVYRGREWVWGFQTHPPTPKNSEVLTKLSRSSLKVLKIKKTLLYEIKFLVPNYSCLQNPWLGVYRPQIPVLSVLCPQLNLLNTPEQNSWVRHWSALSNIVSRMDHLSKNIPSPKFPLLGSSQYCCTQSTQQYVLSTLLTPRYIVVVHPPFFQHFVKIKGDLSCWWELSKIHAMRQIQSITTYCVSLRSTVMDSQVDSSLQNSSLMTKNEIL
jgi:hypothetical protein